MDDFIDELATITNAARGLNRQLAALLSEEGLREDLWRILHALHRTQGALMGELANELHLPPASVTRMVDELVEQGWVFRRPLPEDGRKAAAHLSRAGRERFDRASAVLMAHRNPLSAQARELTASLRRVALENSRPS
ncbi:MarR family winged helix-turn-helix transcriptional regulator [Kineococcus rhizosphaerae]|uniref:MarR family winged helix-turn-helix transcriptional regulator n=1 Tax=Kineococcus rhizosphaerae TaxID=559628 RepID=UPI000D05F9F2|nr:MarR family transcriptional regulator [Kineococcus rhizosphaerae]